MHSLDLVSSSFFYFMIQFSLYIYIELFNGKDQSIIHFYQSLHGIRATIQTSPFLFHLAVGFPPLLVGFHHSSHLLLPPLPPVLPMSWLKNSSKSPSFLIMFHLSPSSTYLIKTLSNSHQQTTSLKNFKLKLSLSATTSINLSMTLTLVHWPGLAAPTMTRCADHDMPNPNFLPWI